MWKYHYNVHVGLERSRTEISSKFTYVYFNYFVFGINMLHAHIEGAQLYAYKPVVTTALPPLIPTCLLNYRIVSNSRRFV